jgi:hypothetical protein
MFKNDDVKVFCSNNITYLLHVFGFSILLVYLCEIFVIFAI